MPERDRVRDCRTDGLLGVGPLADAARHAGGRVRAFAGVWRRGHGQVYAAALAYYSLFSLAPAAVIVAAVVGLMLGPEASAGKLAPLIESFVPGTVAGNIEAGIAQMDATSGSAGLAAGAAGLGVLVWSASRALTTLRQGLDALWGTPPGGAAPGPLGFLVARATAVLVLLIAGLILAAGLLADMVAQALIAALPHDAFAAAAPGLDGIIALIALTALLSAAYRILPSGGPTWRQVWPGATAAGVLIMGGRSAVGWYLREVFTASAYGAAGSVVVILVWMNLTAQLILAGAAVNAVRAGRQTE